MIITIPRLVPSGNKGVFQHWRKYAEERDLWYSLIRAQLTPKVPPEHKVTVQIVSYRQRLLDYGNLVAGCKPIPDGLKKFGVIKDDSPKWFECSYSQIQVSKKDVRTEINITEHIETKVNA